MELMAKPIQDPAWLIKRKGSTINTMSDNSLHDVKSNQIDLEKIPIEDVFTILNCTREGLNDEEGAKRLDIFGPNKLEEKQAWFMWNPLSWVMEFAAIMALILANGGGRPPDWPDFVGIIIGLCNLTGDALKRAQETIDGFANRGLRSLGVARQTVPEKTKESKGSPWEFVGLLPLFDPPRHDSAETIRRALELGVKVKMITGDQLAIAKETGRRLGMGTDMYPSSSLLTESIKGSNSSIDDLIEKADGFAGVFPEHKYEIVKRLQQRNHICGMTGDGVNDAPALKRADIGIAVSNSTDAARSASDIILTEPGLNVIVAAILTSRCIFQRMKNYTIYAVSITIRIVLGFMLIVLIWSIVTYIPLDILKFIIHGALNGNSR
ncbi:hypothetical protein M8C21_001057 [Ambrosia artemisiifolia]|uniref:Cation-transporting P-type ATPase N-terminal domain-containing protein n=1 Tax=Ambrosia artemisiifolia TaxID=4212 RepID=A0AAD5BUM1_AMBAR|nr:hypothetical protein M8C21_001057 [Ambrosia artemisiifolia]